MRISASKSVSILATAAIATVAGLAAIGIQYASATGARPAAAPKANIANVYTTSSTGGTGQVSFNIGNPGKGVYAASFTANFFPAGSPTAPATFSCYLVKDGSLAAQSTSSSTYDSGFYVGVDGSTTVKVSGTTSLTIGCGTADGSAWTWGTKPVSVTLTNLDGINNNLLTSAVHAKTLVAGN